MNVPVIVGKYSTISVTSETNREIAIKAPVLMAETQASASLLDKDQAYYSCALLTGIAKAGDYLLRGARRAARKEWPEPADTNEKHFNILMLCQRNQEHSKHAIATVIRKRAKKGSYSSQREYFRLLKLY